MRDELERIQAQLGDDPSNIDLHDRRYQLALESDDEHLLRAVLTDSARTLQDESFVVTLASFEESCDNHVAALEWRELAMRLRPSRENHDLLDRCRLTAEATREREELGQARKVLASHRLLYRHEPEIVQCLDALEGAIATRDVAQARSLLERIQRVRQARRGSGGLTL